MTLIIDDFRTGLGIAFRPNENASVKLSVGEALSLYYKFSVIPLILFIIVGYFALQGFSSMLASQTGMWASFVQLAQPLASHALTLMITISIGFFWILLPIALLVQAALYQFVGGIFGKFKGGYSASLSAVVFAMLPNVLVAWLSFVPVLGFIIALFASVYGLYVLIVALEKQHKTTSGSALAVWLVCGIALMIIMFIVSSILATLSLFSSILKMGA